MTGLDLGNDRGRRLMEAASRRGLPDYTSARLENDFLKQYPDEGVGGALLGGLAHIGKATIEGGLGLLRAAQWVNEASPIGIKTEGIIGKVPTELRDILPTEQSLRLESRLSQVPFRKAVEVGAGLVPLVAGGGAAGAVGKMAGAPGLAIGGLGAPAVKLGEYLISKAPALQRWSAIAKGLPAALGTAQGFGLYNFLTTEGGMEERAAALAHGAISGAGVSVLGQLAGAAERAILSKTTPLAQRAAWSEMSKDLAAGKNYSGMLRRLDAALVGSTIEATGFAGLDRQWWSDVLAGVKGDEAAATRAMEVWAGSLAGVLLARTGRTDAMMTFRREAPETNNLETRLLAENIRNPKQPPKQPEPQGPQGPQGEPQAAPVKGFASGEPAVETAWRLPALNKASDPLFKSGWDLSPGVEVRDGQNWITMQFPGAGKIRMWENETQAGPATEAFGLEVPVDVFRRVRGNVEVPEGTENIRMVGAVAEEFTRDLAALSMLMRIKGDIAFGAGGEAWAGGPWRSEDGRYHTIGLDGKHYTQGVFPEDGYRLEPDAPMPNTSTGAEQNPQIARWVELVQAMRSHTAQNPGLDLLESSLMLLLRGNPQSRNVQELMRLMAEEWQPGTGMMNADLAEAALNPGNIEQFGLTIGQVAAGHLTAEQAAMQIGTALMGKSEGTQLPAPEQPGGIAGSRDWSQAKPQERREAAKQYVAENPEVTAPMLRDTFLLPRETARDILGEVRKGREGEAGFFRPTDPIEAIGDFAIGASKVAKAVYNYAIPNAADVIAKEGGDAGAEFASKMREIQSRTRDIIGKSGPAAEKALVPAVKRSERGRKFREKLAEVGMREVREKVKISEPRWVGLLEGRIQAEGAAEAAFVESGREALLALKKRARGAGLLMRRPGKEGDVYFEIPDTDRLTVPRVYDFYSKHNFDDLMRNADARQAFFDALAKLNPETGATGKALEERWAQSKSVDKRMSDAERESALDHVRTYDYVPATFTHKGVRYNVLEKDPAVALLSIINKEAARIATVETVGQDLPDKVMKAFGRTKPGMAGYLADATKEVAKASPDTVKAMEKLAMRVQGSEPENVPQALRAYSSAIAVPRALRAALSLAYDIPQIGIEPVVAMGLKRTLAAAADVIRLWGENTKFAEEFGTLAVEMTHLDLGMARNPLERMAELVSAPGKITEEIKTTFYTRAADLFVRSMMEGNAHPYDLRYLEGVLKLRPQEAQSIVDGSASKDLADRVTRELVQLWASRGRISERSMASASPIMRAIIDYLHYSTKRAALIVADASTFLKTMASPKATLGEKADGATRFTYRFLGISVGGLIGTMIGVALVDLLNDAKSLVTGEAPQVPGERVVRQVTSYPFKTVWKSALSQLVSGPLAQFVETAAGQNEKPERMVTPLAQVTAFGEMVKRSVQGMNPWTVLRRFGEETGFWPSWLTKSVHGLFMSAADKRYRNVQSVVSEWERMEGLSKTFGNRTKDSDFYSAMDEVGSIVRAHIGEDKGAIWGKIEPVVMRALEVDSRDAAANRLRTMRLLDGKTDAQLSKLQDYLGTDRYRLAIEHDLMFGEMARMVSAIDKGGNVTPWTEAVTTAAKLAKEGTPNAFGELMERAVEQSAQARVSGAPNDADLEELSEVMAAYPLALQREGGLAESQREMLARRGGDAEALQRMVYAILRDRAAKRMDTIREKNRTKGQ